MTDRGPGPIQITLQYFDGCPNWQTTSALLETLVGKGLDAAIGYELIDSPDAAVARGFRGSPTVLINEVDPFAEADAPVGLACRVYRSDEGYAGSPSLSQLQAALRSAQKE